MILHQLTFDHLKLALLAVASVVPLRCHATELALELSKRTATEGLGIARSGMNPIWFDSQIRTAQQPLSGCDLCEPNSGSWYIRPSLDRPVSTVVDCNGAEVMSIKHWIITEAQSASNNDDVAFIGRYWGPGYHSVRAGLYYAKLRSMGPMYPVIEPEVTVDAAETDVTNLAISWAPTRNRFVFSWKNKIWIYSTASNKKISIASGFDPYWSPDDRWISYRSTDNNAMLIDPKTRAEKPIMVGRHILSGLRWSPDSAYLLFSEDRRPSSSLEMNRAVSYKRNLAVYRLRDEATVVVAPIPDMTANAFFWLPCPRDPSKRSSEGSKP